MRCTEDRGRTRTAAATIEGRAITPRHATRLLGAGCLTLSPVLFIATRFTWPAGSEGSDSQVVRLAATHPVMWKLSGALEAASAVLGLTAAAVVALVVDGRGRILARAALGLWLCATVGAVATWVLNAELVALSQPVRVEVAAPRRVGPPGDPDAHLAHGSTVTLATESPGTSYEPVARATTSYDVPEHAG